MEDEERIRAATDKRRITATGVQRPKMICTPVQSDFLFYSQTTSHGRCLLLRTIAEADIHTASEIKE